MLLFLANDCVLGRKNVRFVNNIAELRFEQFQCTNLINDVNQSAENIRISMFQWF